jgi:hypothetical protein
VTDRIYTGSVAETLADGRPLGFGDEVSLDADAEKANQHLIDAGVLPEKPKAKTNARKGADQS